MSAKTPPQFLAGRTADMLALPQTVCRRRACRRKNACHWYFNRSGEPCCLRNLTAEQRRCFDELLQQAHRIMLHGGFNGLVYASRDPVTRALEDAGVEIARTMMPDYDRKRFAAFMRERERMPPPRPAER